MNDITYAVSVDVNNPTIPYNAYVASVLDSNVRYLEITLYQNGNVIALSNTATATASLVTDNVLVDDSVNCTISDNIITVPLEDLQRHGNLDVQVTVTEGTKALAIPFPIQVRVTPNIAEEAQIDENSMGSYAEVVQEIADARRGYNSLNERINNAAAPTDEQVAEAVSDYFDEHPISGAEKFVEVTDASDTAVDNCTNPDTVYIVRVVSGVVTTTKMRVICTPNVAGQMAQYAMTKDGYIISRKFTASEWGAWDFIPDSKRVAAMISAAIAGKADSSAIPTKTSELKNDSGFLTSHQDVSGKENTSNKKTSISNQSQTGDSDTNYPTVGAVRDYTDGKVSELEGYVGDKLDDMDTAKADKATTLSGYGITDGQTKIDSSHKLSSDLVDDTNKSNKFVTSSEKTSWNGKYSKPSGGIPKTDLASAVQTSLGKADSALQSHQDISGKVDKEAGKGLSTNDFTDSDKNLLEAGCTETKNRFNLGTDIILGKNGTGGSSSIRAITVALNTGGGKSVVSVKNLPPNLKYQVWGYNDGNFTSPTNYTTAWIEKRGQSTVVAKPYVRVLFGTVNNATITMADFEGLELQVEEGEQKTDYAPKYTAFDYVARNRSYPVHLKVCSYNVGMYSNGISTDTPATNALENMSGFLGANNFDILGIQEGRSYVNGTNADETVYNDYFISQKSLLNNCAIKSQFVLKDTGEGTFTAGSRKYVYATAIIGNKEVFIINVHLALTATDRASNYTELLALLKAHEYFIAFGDFNAAIDYNTGVEEQTQAEYNNLINAGYTVANGGRWGLLTTIGTQTKYPDNICVSGNIKMITSKTADVYATMNSDHIPIIAELVV